MMIFTRLLVLFAMFGMALARAETSVWDHSPEALTPPVEITVHRSPSCGCCGKWIDHIKRHGFLVKDIKETEMDALKARLGIPEKLKSCHTAEVGGYLIEGHVPASDIKRLLVSKPDLAGIAVAGMPIGPPGMEMGARKEPFRVLGFWKDGRTSVFADYASY